MRTVAFSVILIAIVAALAIVASKAESDVSVHGSACGNGYCQGPDFSNTFSL